MQEPGPPIDPNTMTELFLQRNMIKEATAFLLDVLAADLPEQAMLQTKLLEVNLITNPQVCSCVLRVRSLYSCDESDWQV